MIPVQSQALLSSPTLIKIAGPFLKSLHSRKPLTVFREDIAVINNAQYRNNHGREI